MTWVVHKLRRLVICLRDSRLADNLKNEATTRWNHNQQISMTRWNQQKPSIVP
jgi:hypothetical protein